MCFLYLLMSFYSDEVSKLTIENFSIDHQVKQVIHARQFMDSRFADDIKLNDIAGAGWSSKFHFIRLFKKYYGRTPNQYLVEKRVAQAKKFLRSGHGVGEACIRVGFNSSTTFAGLFKKITGLSPANFKKKAILES
jgi:AraC-like DNA-binding protein